MTILTKESIVLFLAHVKNYHKKSTTFLHSALKNIHLHPQCNVYARSTFKNWHKIKRPPHVRRSLFVLTAIRVVALLPLLAKGLLIALLFLIRI